MFQGDFNKLLKSHENLRPMRAISVIWSPGWTPFYAKNSRIHPRFRRTFLSIQVGEHRCRTSPVNGDLAVGCAPNFRSANHIGRELLEERTQANVVVPDVAIGDLGNAEKSPRFPRLFSVDLLCCRQLGLGLSLTSRGDAKIAPSRSLSFSSARSTTSAQARASSPAS